MRPQPPRRSFTLLCVLVLAGTVACSSSGTGGGCTALSPIPTGWFPSTEKTDNTLNVRLSPAGISYINQNWRTLLDTFAPGQQLIMPVACTPQSVTGVGTILIADQGGTGCNSESCGKMDGKCDSKDVPKDVTIDITAFHLAPKSPDSIDATITLAIDTGNIYLDSTDRSEGVCLFLSPIKCHVNYASDNANDAYKTNKLAATVKFSIDTKWDKLLAFNITTLNGTQICGASGAPAPPECLDADDIILGSDNTCGKWCSAANLGFVKNFILQQLSPFLQGKIKDALAAQSCQACGNFGDPDCPQLPGAASHCDSNKSYCVDNASPSKCVPRFLGVEGRLSPSAFLGNFGVGDDVAMDMSIAAGSTVKVDTGIDIGTRGGIKAVQVADCVPQLTAPPLTSVTAPDFDAEAIDPQTGNTFSYHVGLSISQPFIDLALFNAHQSGTLCFNISSSTVGLLNTGLFKTFLPSLGKLATRDGKDAPMMVVIRPAAAPTVTIGPGTYDPVTKKPVDPLIKLDLPNLTIDFYAMIDDRFARLFSLTADISLPLSLIFEGCSTVTPALGDLKQLVTNIKTSNSEMLAEDPKVLADLIPAVIGFAEPALSSALKPFNLPDLGAFKLKVDQTKGLSQIAGTNTFEHLGIYADLLPAGQQCAVAAPLTTARLVRSQIPSADQMRLTGKPLPWPVAVLQVSATGLRGKPEFSYRVDHGLWTTFLAPSATGELEVSDPGFLLQGRHLIEVRSRIEQMPHGVSAPVPVDFVVDWDPPTVKLTADREHGVLTVKAHDVVTSDDRLEYAYQVGDEPLGAFGRPRLIDLAAVEQAGGVKVSVRDEAGNVGEATYRVATTDLREGGATGSSPKDPSHAGCDVAGGSLAVWATLVAAGALWRRRARRS